MSGWQLPAVLPSARFGVAALPILRFPVGQVFPNLRDESNTKVRKTLDAPKSCKRENKYYIMFLLCINIWLPHLRRYAFWFLGEHAQLWGSGFLPTDVVIGVYRQRPSGAIDSIAAANLLTTVILRLQQGLWFEGYQVKSRCLWYW